MDRFTLLPGYWYGLSMYPGYGDCPYHSPILVRSIEPLGDRKFELAFWNLAYAGGVQDFKKQLRTLRRGLSHLVAAETEVQDRTYVLVHFNTYWLKRYFPKLDASRFFDASGQPDDQALLAMNTTGLAKRQRHQPMTAINHKREFDRLINDRLIHEFCDNPKKPLAPESFRSETLSNVSEYDARYFLMAIKAGLIEHQGCGHYTAPLSTAHEQFFWEGRKTVQPQPFTLWVEPIITVAGLARLHWDHGWPKRLLGMQAKGWAFDLLAMYPDSQSMFIACEVKKSAKELEALLAFMRQFGLNPAAEKPKAGNALNAYKKVLGLREHRPKLFWALGPDRLSEVFDVGYGASGQIELKSTSESALRFPRTECG